MVERPATRVLVVGCGSIGRRHARLLAERPDVEVSVCDTLADNLQAALAGAPGAKGFDDFETALAVEPDAVFVCTPNDLHRPMSLAALEAGCDVLCEKPLADTVENAAAVAEAAAASDRMLHVGYSLRSHAGLRRLRELVEVARAQEGLPGPFAAGMTDAKAMREAGICAGNPDEVAATVQRYKDAGVDQLVTLPRLASWVEDEEVIWDSIRLFGKEVIPRFKS